MRRETVLLLVVACSSPAATRAPAPAAAVAAAPASCLDAGTSPCLSARPISVLRGVIAWSDELGERARTGPVPPLGLTECRWVEELSQVLLCGSADIAAINPALTRAGMFIEHAGTRGTIASRDTPDYAAYLRRIGGFDFMKDHPDPDRPDLLGFYAALDAACRRDQKLCPDAAEAALRGLLETAWAGKDRFVVITFPHVGPVADDEVVSHEILHAQLFTDDTYHRVVETYWRDLDPAEKTRVRRSLARAGYDPDDDLLAANELQAYVLMSGAEVNRMAHLVPIHRPALLAALRAAGREPLQTERRAP